MNLNFLIPPALMLVSVAAVVGAVHWTRHRQNRPDRRSPLTEGLLRPPGHALRERLMAVQWDVAMYFSFAIGIPLMLYATYLQQRLAGEPVSVISIAIYAFAGLAALAFVAFKTTSALREVRNQTLGLEAEMAAAEEVNRLMRRGYTSFHDVPAGKEFNIDHVLVGPSGVYAIETKGRPKRARGSGKAGSTVRFDGLSLEFPGWQETRPIDQSRANAVWLKNWLSSGVGENVIVRPVLLLPGWWVERTGRSDVMVGNAKEIGSMVEGCAHSNALCASLQDRIIHQLDQRCRNLEPKAYVRHS